MAEHNEIGKIGEALARTFLMKHGFSILDQNYRTRYGEIDIVMEKGNKIRFVEVKSIKVTSFENLEKTLIHPEDNLTDKKFGRVAISAETYLKHKNIPRDKKWQIDLACVYINQERREGRVKLIENIN